MSSRQRGLREGATEPAADTGDQENLCIVHGPGHCIDRAGRYKSGLLYMSLYMM